MLLDAIIWLPTLFTYILFLLILIILFFIVAYVSHKIYISIYDNLPLPAAPGSRYSLSISPHRVQSTRSEAVSARSIWIQNRSQIYESSVAVRIVLTLEACYLVSVELDIYKNPAQRAISFMCNCKPNVNKCAAVAPRAGDSVRVLKYYDHLSRVPRLKVLLRCNERKNMRLVLDDVIKDVMETNSTDHAAACPAPCTGSSRQRRTDDTTN
ncbi:hypothetical protein AWZ03_008135 [Drosophila navojoa]|uniref:Uncharacterized protein n=1 Tax=Drosophila navojoa TaxID=7232 RepID=A0A484BB33_DRONA|nr:hypothetical protein AWZ03_008135 [Drosophila navojoa]